MYGVNIFNDGTDQPLVVKASNEPVEETVLGSVFFKKMAARTTGVSAVPVRAATAAEKPEIKAQAQAKVDWEASASKRRNWPNDANQQPAFVAQHKLQSLAAFDGHVFVQGYAEGQDFTTVTKSALSGNQNLSLLLNNPDYVRRLGFVHALDLFLGNHDRLDAMNMGNWMTKLGSYGNAITLIDNYDPASDSQKDLRQQGGNAEFLSDDLPKLRIPTAPPQSWCRAAISTACTAS